MCLPPADTADDSYKYSPARILSDSYIPYLNAAVSLGTGRGITCLRYFSAPGGRTPAASAGMKMMVYTDASKFVKRASTSWAMSKALSICARGGSWSCRYEAQGRNRRDVNHSAARAQIWSCNRHQLTPSHLLFPPSTLVGIIIGHFCNSNRVAESVLM